MYKYEFEYKSEFKSAQNETDGGLPSYLGFIFLFVSSALYGSTYVPIKQCETGNGMVVQFFLCFGIWVVGFITYCISQFPKFYALPMLGGLFWAVRNKILTNFRQILIRLFLKTGNVNTVPIIKTIGMGLGMLIWNVVSM